MVFLFLLLMMLLPTTSMAFSAFQTALNNQSALETHYPSVNLQAPVHEFENCTGCSETDDENYGADYHQYFETADGKTEISVGGVFLRDHALGWENISCAFESYALSIRWAFPKHDGESVDTAWKAPFVLRRLSFLAWIWWFLGPAPSKIDWWQIPKDFLYGARFGPIRNAKYAAYVRSCHLVIGFLIKPILRVVWRPLGRNNSLLAEHLTTLSIVAGSVASLLESLRDYLFLVLCRVPVFALLKCLSKVAVRWERLSGKPEQTVFENMAERVSSRKSHRASSISAMALNGERCSKQEPSWTEVVFLGPIREELAFRFVFAKIWHSFLGISPSSHAPSWIWANSVFFGVSQLQNYLPHHYNDAIDIKDPNTLDMWENVLGAILQSICAFLSAFFVYNPLYLERGLFASIGARAAWNGLVSGIQYFWKLAIGRQKEEEANGEC